ncbi:dynein axonemal intermediate chain 3 isoform X2 [Ictalurus punctatus]|uniref:Dynein axonemal intermediate chain 3 isoform X2 n=1 Tax=Ictalurus punctatus TaxID=7998 RepID=A0A9F7RGA5_ICTPU|nr:dynein axonemal intermediate chain 3 isoform X2 [Ictalurus punctatus]
MTTPDMSAKKSKSLVSKGKEKEKNKKNDLSPSSEEKKESSGPGTETETEHPDYICPLVLTSATQELFGCRADEDVTGENPYKLLRKDDIVQDMRTRAAVSDFSPIKQAVLDYPEDEMLLVFDREFTYGQRFYLVLTLEAKQSMLTPPAVMEEGEDEGGEELEEEQKSPEPRCWVSLGSERELEEELATDTRDRLHYKISRVRREFRAPVHFSDLSAMETKGAYTEYTSYQDKSFSIRKLEQDCGIQAIANTKNSSSQTTWKYPKNMWTQYGPQELSEEEKESILQSENLKNFLSSNTGRFELAIQQNNMIDVFVDEVCVLGEDSVYEGNADTHLKVYQTFTELRKDKVISYINWHPTISGVIAVSVTGKLSFEEKIDSSTKLLLNPAMIIFWSFSDPIHPQLLLECPDDVLSFHFCPSDSNIIVGGCMNGQVVLWDISGHVDRLQGTRSGVRTKMTNMMYFEEKQQSHAPVVRYCAVSGIESGHRGPVTDVQWLPDNFEVSRSGIPLENKNQISVQIVSCSPDGCVMFWDLRAPRVAAPTDKKHKAEENPLKNPHGVPNTFKHLDLSWKPLFRVTLPKMDGTGEYSPLKFSLRDSVCYTAAVDRSEVPVFSDLCVPSAKHLRHLDTISTKFYVGTEDGELVYTDWKLEKDNESGRLSSPKPTHVFQVHDSLVNTVLRSPFFKDIVLTVDVWTFAIWKEGDLNGPILHSPSSSCALTAGSWSLTRPAVFFIGKEDGSLEVWNLLEKTHEPVLNQNVTTAQISCIKPWIASLKQHFLAVSDHLGTLHVLEVPWTLRHPAPNEEQSLVNFLEREVERLIYFEKRPEVQASERRATGAEEKDNKLMRSVDDMMEKMEDNLMEEVQKDYKEYFALEKLLLKNMGLVKETRDTDNV